MDTNHPTYIKINNTFDRVMDEISKFEKVFQPGGKLEQAIMEIEGDPSSLSSIVLVNGYLKKLFFILNHIVN